MAPNEIVAFWLMPAAAEREFFDGVIADLARRFDAPVFEPHVTLFAGKMEEAAAVKLMQHFKVRESVQLQIDEIEASEKFTKTLFVQFEQAASATALARSIKNGARTDGDYRFNPHLSLLYADVSDEVKAELATSITIPFHHVTFDSLKVIVTPARIRTRAEVESWRTIGQQALAPLPA